MSAPAAVSDYELREKSDLVADKGECADKDKEDDEGEEIRDGAHDCGRGIAACLVWLRPVGLPEDVR